eukprot:TRINITY_DN6632_c0_g1_i1.p1 TRINITY_DN6632_c0_g1~~TRINITY_DN6632_c0_g1_i1.p1  ORF type:complete len:126 (-),score=22.80 TRINITY_DN6632_c0_g1_i1:90-467(-)
MDRNQRKLVSYKTLKLFFESILNDDESFQNTVDQAFEAYDTDGNNALDAQEINDFIDSIQEQFGVKHPNQGDPEAIQAFFEDFDANADAKLSKEEFRPMLKETLNTMLDVTLQNIDIIIGLQSND